MNQTPENPPRLTVAMLIYPDMTVLDMIGPQTIWGYHAETYFVWEKKGAVMGDSGAAVIATNDFDDCPTTVDIVCVPGGGGALDVIENEAALAFLRRIGSQARYVTSVCTGSLVLAAAGLLDGHKAATHWAVYPLLEALGIEGVRERVVIDGNRITGGGVTAGIDFGLTVLAEIRGEEVAKTTQLVVEYDPAPPFDAGSPERAGPEIVANVQAMLGGEQTEKIMRTIQAAAARRSQR